MAVIEALATIVMSFLSGIIGATVIWKIVIKPREMMWNLIDEILQDEEMQRKLYTIGGIIGSGAASGLGIQKRSGKMGLQDIIMQLVSGYLNKGLAQPSNQPAGKFESEY